MYNNPYMNYQGFSQQSLNDRIDNQISQLRFMVDNSTDEILIKDQTLSVGDKVKVIRGALMGVEGLVCFVEEKKPMVAIRLDFLGYACVNIPTTDIEQLK